MSTTLFNLQSVSVEDHELLIEFYAGDIFDVYSDILVLSAYKNGFVPVPGTTWGRLNEALGINVYNLPETAMKRASENVIEFTVKPNRCFSRLVALEMISLLNKRNFTLGTLQSRYRDLGEYLNRINDPATESLSLPLLGTGNQKISYADSITGLLNMITHLNRTGLKIIRIFANSYQAIGSLNLRINQIYQREEASSTPLLDAATGELKALMNQPLSDLSAWAIGTLLSLSRAKHTSYDTFGIAGRHYAELVTNELYELYDLGIRPGTLHLKLTALSPSIRNDSHFVYSYLRLLQNYGNQASHAPNPPIYPQDAAAIVIAIARIIDFYESKLASLQTRP